MAGAVAEVLAHARSRPGRLKHGRLICIDGPAGSGKTTLAAAVAAAAPDTVVLHMDDMYDGWDGLLGDTGARLRDHVMTPLSDGVPGHYRRYDWFAGRFAELHLVPPSELLVLEGVGSGDRALAPFRSTLVWVEAPEDLRAERGLARGKAIHEAANHPWDEQAEQANWAGFVADQATFFAEHGLPAAADVRVDGTTPYSPAGPA